MLNQFYILLAILSGFFITYFSIPSLIEIAKKNNIFDHPNERSSHTDLTPYLGGVGILLGVIISFFLFAALEGIPQENYLVIAMLIIFSIGLKDDLMLIKPMKKLLGQFITAGFAVLAGISLTNLQDVLGFKEIPSFVAIPLTLLAIVYIINAFNLIDGINGLSAGIGIWVVTFLGGWFFLIERIPHAIIAFSLMGTLIAFLIYNRTPAKIFMGDSGSLLVGFLIAVLLIEFIQFHNSPIDNHYFFNNAPLVATGIFLIPLFDFLRVASERFLFGKSPMSPDRKHVHHLCVDAGYSHNSSSILIVLLNIIFACFTYLFQDYGFVLPIFVLFILYCIIVSYLKTSVILYKDSKHEERRQMTNQKELNNRKKNKHNNNATKILKPSEK